VMTGSSFPRKLLLLTLVCTVGMSHALNIGVALFNRPTRSLHALRLCDGEISEAATPGSAGTTTSGERQMWANNLGDEPPRNAPTAIELGLGPFASSLGKWDGEGDPNFLQSMDWHPASKMTPEQRAAAEEELLREDEEEEELAAMALAAEDIIDGASPGYVEAEYEYISFCDDFEIPEEHPQPKTRMPSTWQEYQFLQEQVATFAESADLETDREQAGKHESSLKELYDTFKDVLAYGWSLDFHPDVDEAAVFVSRMMTLQGEKKQKKTGFQIEMVP